MNIPFKRRERPIGDLAKAKEYFEALGNVEPMPLEKFEPKYPPPPEPVEVPKLDDIAWLVRSLTYSEMIELAEALWKAKSEGDALTALNLPAVLHSWSLRNV